MERDIQAVTNFAMSRYKGEDIEISPEALESRVKRSRSQVKAESEPKESGAAWPSGAEDDVTYFAECMMPYCSEQYTGLLMGTESCFWDSYCSQAGPCLESCDGTSSVVLGCTGTIEGEVKEGDLKTEFFLQEAWNGIAESVRGAEWANLIAGGSSSWCLLVLPSGVWFRLAAGRHLYL